MNEIICLVITFAFSAGNILTRKSFHALLTVLTIFFTYNSDIAYSQWIQQTLPLSGNSYNVIFFDSNTGILSSDTPALFRTTNGGVNWVLINHFVIFTGMSKIDSTTLYGRGRLQGEERIYRTFNKGLTWDSVAISINNAYSSISFTNKDTGWVSGFDGNNYLLWKTNNGGVNLIPLTYSVGVGTLYMYREPVNGNYIGWHSFGVGTRKTTDGGATWFLVSSTIGIGCTYFLNKDTGWTTCASSIYKTFDGGYNWTRQQLPHGNYILDTVISSFIVINKNIIYGFGGDRYFPNHRVFGIIWKTTNGGNNWGYQQPDTTSVKIGGYISGYFIDSLTGWVGNYDYGNKVAFTNNGGGPIVYTKINSNNQNIVNNFKLYQNYPNPFNNESKIEYKIVKTSNVKIVVFDISGKEISTLINKRQNSGEYSTRFDGSNLSSGIYFYSLFIDGLRVDTKKMIYIK